MTQIHERRAHVISELKKNINDDRMVRHIERGCYKLTREKATERHIPCKWSNVLFVGIYQTVAFEVMSALDPCSDSYAPNVAARLNDGSIDPLKVAYLQPREMQPERQREADEIIEKSQGSRSNAVRASTFYRCVCGSELTQTRNVYASRADEGVSKQVRCLKCGNTWRES